jgi:dipeptidyl-peptidase-4
MGVVCLRTLSLWLLVTVLFAAVSQNAAAEALTLERIFASPALEGAQPRSLEIAPDGSRVTFLRGKDEDRDRLDLWEFNLADRATRVLVDSAALLTEEGELSDEEKARRERQRIAQFSGIVDYQWTKDASALLFPLGGDVYLYTLAAGEARQVTETKAFETDPKLSPGGRYVSFIRDRDLFVVELSSGSETALTDDGEGTVSNGMAEFVAQEEMDRDTGYWWSPDERHIAYLRVDNAAVPLEQRYEVLGSEILVREQRYPAAGTNNAAVSLFVVDVESGVTRELRISGDGDFYLPRVTWLPNGRHIAVQRQSRDQQELVLLVFDIATGEPREVLAEHAETFINLHDDLRFLEHSAQFLWSSERPGYRHLYLYGLDGAEVRQLTRGDWEVTELEAVDEAGGWVYFTGTREGPGQRHLYRVPLAGGEVRQLTRRTGKHDVQMAESGHAYVDSFSSGRQPTQVSVHDAGGKRLAWLSENAVSGDHPYAPYLAGHGDRVRGTLSARDGQSLHWQLMRPTDFDPGRRYPVIVRVYGGPTVQIVTDSWSWKLLVEQFWVQQGYLVFTLDNRGVQHYGKAFQKPVYKRLGVVDTEDQLRGVEWLKQQGYVDGERIGVFGWSYGGYLTLMAMMQSPGTFAAGVAVAPVTDWALYDTHYTERYMGTPQADAEAYRLGDVLTYAGQLSDPLLLVHGMADDNVLFTHTTRLMESLQQAAIPFELMTYPGGKHSLVGENIRVHVYRTITDFFNRHLQP